MGWGEADTLPAFLSPIVSAPRHDDMMGGLAAILLGRDARDIGGAWQAMVEGTSSCGRDGLARMAMAAVDIALWDLAGQALSKPVHALLGRARRAEMAFYATHALGSTLEETRRHAPALQGVLVDGQAQPRRVRRSHQSVLHGEIGARRDPRAPGQGVGLVLEVVAMRQGVEQGQSRRLSDRRAVVPAGHVWRRSGHGACARPGRRSRWRRSSWTTRSAHASAVTPSGAID